MNIPPSSLSAKFQFFIANVQQLVSVPCMENQAKTKSSVAGWSVLIGWPIIQNAPQIIAAILTK